MPGIVIPTIGHEAFRPLPDPALDSGSGRLVVVKASAQRGVQFIWTPSTAPVRVYRGVGAWGVLEQNYTRSLHHTGPEVATS